MCGIIGAVAKQKLNPALLINSLKDLEHRGPDAKRFHILEEEQLYFGHTRLKIIDRSDKSNQPLYSPCGRWSIIFNGEIYNYKDLRREIGNIWKWQTSGDTEVLMAAWSLWGLQCLNKLVGMFAFAVYDKDKSRLFLVRDRFGIKPLYFSCIGSNFFFSSEIKPLLRIQTKVKPNESTIRTYLEIGLYDHTPATFFQNIQAVRPGTCIEYNLKEDYKKEYSWYSLEKNIPDLQDASEGELLDKAEHLILQAVSSHLVADVGVGLNVSGGVDSSMLISAFTESVGSADLFMQEYAGYSELPWLKETADLNRLNIISLSATDILTLFKETVKSQCEPFGGVFVCGYHALYQRACQKGVTVLLDGNGVDETFLGYERYHRLFVSSAKNSHQRQKREKDYDAFWGGELTASQKRNIQQIHQKEFGRKLFRVL